MTDIRNALQHGHADPIADRHYAQAAAELDRLHDALAGEAVLRKALVQQVRRLTEALEEANQVLRSAYQVAARGGIETNWPPFTSRIDAVLKSQHAILHAQPE